MGCRALSVIVGTACLLSTFYLVLNVPKVRASAQMMYGTALRLSAIGVILGSAIGVWRIALNAKLDRNPELIQTLLASKKFRDWKPRAVQQKRSDGAANSLEYSGKNHDTFPSYSYQNKGANSKLPLEKHYMPAEVAEIWGSAWQTAIR